MDVYVRMFFQVSEILILFIYFGALDHPIEFFELDFVFDVFLVVISVFIFGISVFGP